MSQLSAGDDWPRITPMFRALISVSSLKAAYNDRHGVDRVVRASGADWTLVRPVALSGSPAVLRCGPPRQAPRSRQCGSAAPTSPTSSWVHANDIDVKTGARATAGIGA
ncbi:hypothetical protein CF165_47440 [Amycolatopsis vastitatis]|uniref:Uncharacterized protein n=1 Tax=Amycolatopsis vastitatis TaxID=1905142 RepID=A0A229SL61_9PSEU|nr:hypothetical protein CF165_47440 [Amycolatopsis vastitatis]